MAEVCHIKCQKSSDKVKKIETKYLEVKRITKAVKWYFSLVSNERQKLHSVEWITASGICLNALELFLRYLGRLPASTAHHHRSGSLLRSLAPEQRREPRGHLSRRRGNHPRALSMTSFSVNAPRQHSKVIFLFTNRYNWRSGEALYISRPVFVLVWTIPCYFRLWINSLACSEVAACVCVPL